MKLRLTVDREIAAIASDTEHGASHLAREALRVAGRCAERSRQKSRSALLAEFHACAAALIAARPGMAPVRHWLDRLSDEVVTLGESVDDLAILRAAIGVRADDLIHESARASRRAAENAAARLEPGSTVFTASFSQTIVEACRRAHAAGKLRRVLAAESVDARGHRYGQQLAAALAGDGLSVEVIPDDLAPARVAEADLVWLGADSVLADGAVLNGAPSLAIARAAHDVGKPVIVICETAKIDRDASPENVVVPAGMDWVPAEYVRMIQTEREE